MRRLGKIRSERARKRMAELTVARSRGEAGGKPNAWRRWNAPALNALRRFQKKYFDITFILLVIFRFLIFGFHRYSVRAYQTSAMPSSSPTGHASPLAFPPYARL